MKKNQLGTLLCLFITIMVFVGCKKDKDKDKSYKISLSNTDQIGAKATFAITKGEGDLTPSEYGMVYSKNSNPTTSDNKITISGDSEIKTLKGLDLSTTYYARPFVTDKKGTTYYDEIEFKTYCFDVDSISPRSASVGATITVYGRGFATIGSDTDVGAYNSTTTPKERIITVTNISSTQLSFTVPGTLATGNTYKVSVARYNANCNYAYSIYNSVEPHSDEPKLHLTVTN